MRKAILLMMAIVALLPACKDGKKASELTDESRLQYTPEVNEVEVVPLKRETFQMQLLANGKLSAAQKSALYFAESGQITAVNVSNGGAVGQGAVIARLDSREQESRVEAARIEVESTRLEYLSFLAGQGYAVADSASVPQDVRELAAIRSGYAAAQNSLGQARRALEGTVLRAPFSGKVADIKLKKWDRTTSEPFCTLISDRTFDVEFSALESEYPFLQKGQPVRVSLFGEDDRSVKGTIKSINPAVDRNGQILVTTTVPGDGRMLDGMNVKVIVERAVPDQLVVPKRAVVIRDNLEVLFRYNDGKSDWVYVNTLKANSESFAIQANADRGAELHEGDLIIVSGNLNLADGSKVVIKGE